MKKICYFTLAALTALVFGCSDKKGFVTTFKGSIEGGDWINTNTGYNGGGHTGDLSSKVDSVNQFSYGFSKLISEISDKPIKKIKISVWVKLENMEKKVALVVALTDKNNKQIFWESQDVNPDVKEINKYSKISTEFKLPDFENEGTLARVYIWNPNGNVANVDDFEIQFLEE